MFLGFPKDLVQVQKINEWMTILRDLLVQKKNGDTHHCRNVVKLPKASFQNSQYLHNPKRLVALDKAVTKFPFIKK